MESVRRIGNLHRRAEQRAQAAEMRASPAGEDDEACRRCLPVVRMMGLRMADGPWNCMGQIGCGTFFRSCPAACGDRRRSCREPLDPRASRASPQWSKTGGPAMAALVGVPPRAVPQWPQWLPPRATKRALPTQLRGAEGQKRAHRGGAKMGTVLEPDGYG